MNTKVNQKEKQNILRKGEQQRSNGTFGYQWSDNEGKRHIIYAKTLSELREKEKNVEKDIQDNLKPEARYKTVNDIYERWKDLKRGLKDNTFQNYQYLYTMYVAPKFGRKKLSEIVKSDVKQFYNTLVDVYGLAISTVDGVRICEKYNSIYKTPLPLITPHICRHTFCSNMAKSGMNPKTLQYLMGHSDIGITLNTYTHLKLEDVEAECRKVSNKKGE